MGGSAATAEREWQSVFQREFAAAPSRIAERILGEVFGDEYPGLDTHSFLTVSELRRFVVELEVAPGQILADVGCGRGGPGMWVAAATGTRLIGIDIAEGALDAARERAAALDLAAEFRLGSFEATGLRDESVHGVMSVDALPFTLSKAAALSELHRILRPGGRLAFTSWDYDRQPVGRPPQVDDHRPLLRAAGFDVRVYRQSEGWRAREVRALQLLLDACDELAAESGEPVDIVRAGLEEQAAATRTMTRRVFAVAVAT